MKISYLLGITVGLGLILAGCASTKTTEPTKLVGGKFLPMYGNQGQIHKYSGLVCQNTQGDMQFGATHMYNDQGTDVSCGWREGEDRRYLTLYASQVKGVDFAADWQQTRSVVDITETPRGLSYDEAKSAACLSSALTVLTSKNTDASPFTLEAAVFTSDAKTSLVTYHKASGDWLIKVRSTWPANAGKLDTVKFNKMCTEAAQLTQKQSQNVTKAGWK